MNLSKNQINNVSFVFISSCLSKLEVLDLSNNFISKVPDEWISKLSLLKKINLSKNELTFIPYSMFYNISNIEEFDVSFNNLTTFELWLIQVKTLVDYSNNRVTQITNENEVDLSEYQSNITKHIVLNNTGTRIEVYDNLFEMYNRCTEIHDESNRILMKAIKQISDFNSPLLVWNCSCERYYFQIYLVSINYPKNISTWICNKDPRIYIEKCNYQSSFNFETTKPRLCKINGSNLNVVS